MWDALIQFLYAQNFTIALTAIINLPNVTILI